MAHPIKQQGGGRRWRVGTVLTVAACGVAGWWFTLATLRPEPSRVDSPCRVTPASRNEGSARGPADAISDAPPVGVPPAAQRVIAASPARADGGSSVGDDEAKAPLAATIDPDDLPAVLGYLLRPDSVAEERDRGLQRLRSWADTAPRVAAEWLDRQPALAGRAEAVEQVATAWGGQDLEEASRWAGQLPTEEERQRALQAVVYEGARSHPTLAMTLAIEGLPAGAERDGFLRHATAQWASAEPAEALAWAQQLSGAALRDPIIATVATEWSERDPLAGATLAVEQLPAGRLQNDTIVSIVERWVQVNPRAVADWVATGFPDGELRTTAATEMVKIWAEQDMEEVVQWLAELEAGPLRETALTAYACKLLPHAVVIAAELTRSLADPKAQDDLALVVVDEWLKMQTLAAGTSIDGSPPALDRKERLLMALH